jgi:hypothetical protein
LTTNGGASRCAPITRPGDPPRACHALDGRLRGGRRGPANAAPAAVPDGGGGAASETAPSPASGAFVPDAAHGIVPQNGGEFAPGWTVAPQINIAEAFNDNIRQTERGRKADFVTYVGPLLLVRGDTPRLQASLHYAPTAGIYAANSGQDFVAQNLNAYALATLVEDALFLDARAFAGVSPTRGGFPVGAAGFGAPVFGGFGSGSATSTLLSGSNQTQTASPSRPISCTASGTRAH